MYSVCFDICYDVIITVRVNQLFEQYTDKVSLLFFAHCAMHCDPIKLHIATTIYCRLIYTWTIDNLIRYNRSGQWLICCVKTDKVNQLCTAHDAIYAYCDHVDVSL